MQRQKIIRVQAKIFAVFPRVYCRNSAHPATLFAGDSGKENGFFVNILKHKENNEFQPKGSNGNGERFAEDVCFADLVAFIDAEVETDDPDGEEYQAKASKAAADAFNGLFNA